MLLGDVLIPFLTPTTHCWFARPWEAIAVANKRIVSVAAPHTAATSVAGSGSDETRRASGNSPSVPGISDSV